MNKNRRKQLAAISASLENLKGDLEQLIEEEQHYLDNMPESISAGDKGDKAQEVIDGMEYGISEIESAIDNIDMARR